MTRWIPVLLTATHLADGWVDDAFMSPVVLALNAVSRYPWRLAGPRAVLQVPGGSVHPGRDQVWRLPPPVVALLARLSREEAVAPCTLRLPRRFTPWVRSTTPQEEVSV
jgi:hypothetical protein